MDVSKEIRLNPCPATPAGTLVIVRSNTAIQHLPGELPFSVLLVVRFIASRLNSRILLIDHPAITTLTAEKTYVGARNFVMGIEKNKILGAHSVGSISISIRKVAR